MKPTTPTKRHAIQRHAKYRLQHDSGEFVTSTEPMRTTKEGGRAFHGDYLRDTKWDWHLNHEALLVE